MRVILFFAILIAEVSAQTQPQAPQDPGFLGALTSMMPMLAICYLIFYFMVVKPQANKVKSHNELISSLKRGDTVVTSGGIVGKVAGNENDYVILEVSQGVKIKVESAYISRSVDETKKAQAA